MKKHTKPVLTRKQRAEIRRLGVLAGKAERAWTKVLADPVAEAIMAELGCGKAEQRELSAEFAWLRRRAEEVLK